MTEEMIQAMAFETAKISVANNSKNPNGIPFNAEQLAHLMYQEYNAALKVIKQKVKEEELDLNFDAEEFAKNSARFK